LVISLFLENRSFLCYIFLMSVTQTVNIPANHRLTIDVPPEVPAGPVIITFTPKAAAQVELKAIPFDKKPANSGKLRLSKQDLDEMLRNSQTPISDSLTGILADLGDITIEQIREERLAKYLK
jgi:hypothetical protein